MHELTVNGVQIAFERIKGGPSTSSGGAGTPPLVLIHGFPLDHSSWDALLPHLEGADVLLPDLRGFGGSAVVDGAYTIADMAQDVIALLDALKIEKAAIVGHSMGGYVALEIARKVPGRVSGLGLVATQALPDAPERKAARYATAGKIGDQGSIVVADSMAPKLSADPQYVPAIHALILRQPAAGVMGALAAMAERADSTDLLPTFKFPVAIAHGLADGLIPVERSREMKALIPQASLTEIADVGHMPMLDAPAETAKALKEGLIGGFGTASG